MEGDFEKLICKTTGLTLFRTIPYQVAALL